MAIQGRVQDFGRGGRRGVGRAELWGGGFKQLKIPPGWVWEGV